MLLQIACCNNVFITADKHAAAGAAASNNNKSQKDLAKDDLICEKEEPGELQHNNVLCTIALFSRRQLSNQGKDAIYTYASSCRISI